MSSLFGAPSYPTVTDVLDGLRQVALGLCFEPDAVTVNGPARTVTVELSDRAAWMAWCKTLDARLTPAAYRPDDDLGVRVLDAVAVTCGWTVGINHALVARPPIIGPLAEEPAGELTAVGS